MSECLWRAQAPAVHSRSALFGLVSSVPFRRVSLGAGLRGLYCQAMMNLQIRRSAMPPRGQRKVCIRALHPSPRLGHGTCVGVPIALRSGGMT